MTMDKKYLALLILLPPIVVGFVSGTLFGLWSMWYPGNTYHYLTEGLRAFALTLVASLILAWQVNKMEDFDGTYASA